jgi:hypothetical protein
MTVKRQAENTARIYQQPIMFQQDQGNTITFQIYIYTDSNASYLPSQKRYRVQSTGDDT